MKKLLALFFVAAMCIPGFADVTPPSSTLTSSITATKTNVKESSTFSIKMVVTNTGATTVTGIHPSSLDVNGTGWATLFKWPSPALASIAPGKTVKFSMTYKAMLAGTVTLSGNATSTDGNSVASSSPLITILPKKISAAAVTDDLGNATLKSGKVTLPIHLVDETTGSPIAGLSAAMVLDKKRPGRAVLAVVDGLGRYPAQILLLHGANTNNSLSMAKLLATSQDSNSSPVEVPVDQPCNSSGVLTRVMAPIETTSLPPLKPLPEPPSPTKPGTEDISQPDSSIVSKALAAAWTAWNSITQNPTVQKFVLSQQTVPCSKALETDSKLITTTAKEYALFVPPKLIAAELCPKTTGVLSVVGMGNTILYAIASYRDIDFCKNPNDGVMIKEYKLFPGILPQFNSLIWHVPLEVEDASAPQFVDLPVTVTDASGQPISGGSLELVSRANLGSGFRAVISDGVADLSVPLDDYDWCLRSPGFEPQSGQISITDSNAAINAVMQPQLIASGIINQDRIAGYGFLPEGTQFTVTPRFFDINGTEVNCDGPVKYYAHNPVGTLVATVDSNTGLVTMQGGCGAAGITAWCNGVESRRLLVSTDCDGKLPPNPNCAYSIFPTAGSFTASGGDGSATVATSDDTCAWTATSNAGWITISSGNSGSGNGTVGYSVAENSGTSKRVGKITIAGKTFTVTQAGSSTSSNKFDGNYEASVTTVTPLGTTTGQGTFTVTGGFAYDPGFTFIGTVDAKGEFTGTTTVCKGCSPMAMTGTFSLTGNFTISGASGNVSQTVVAHKVS